MLVVVSVQTPSGGAVKLNLQQFGGTEFYVKFVAHRSVMMPLWVTKQRQDGDPVRDNEDIMKNYVFKEVLGT